MREFLIFTVLLIIAWIIGKLKSEENDTDLFSFEYTTLLKGGAIITVLWAHVGEDLGVGYIQWIAGIGVSLFLILSGFGLQTSYLKNGLLLFWKKRLINVVIPYYFVFLVLGIFIHRKDYLNYSLKVITFRAQWYIGYIMICYVLFWTIMLISEHIKINSFMLICVSFIVWFFIDSLFFTISDCPFLRARQMWSFPLGIYIAKNKIFTCKIIKSNKCILLNTLAGFVFLILTQIDQIKELNIVISNLLSLFTVVPLAISVIGITLCFYKLLYSKFLILAGQISFELYLVQNFSRKVLEKGNIISVILFLVFTIGLGYLIYRADILIKGVGTENV